LSADCVYITFVGYNFRGLYVAVFVIVDLSA